MPVPDYESLMLPLLSALADGDEHEVATLRDRIAASLKLTDTDRAELLPSGKQSVFDNRVGWAKFYLDKAGLVVSTRRGVYKITDLGEKALGQKPSRIDRAFLLQFDSFKEFIQREREDDQEVEATPEPAGVATPEEVLETAYRQIRKKVEADLLLAVAKASPRFFEKLVVELLVKMGYGGDIKDAGKALGRSHDGGLDGLIKEDHLGLDAIYIQAKRWQNNVGRPELQSFSGSLDSEHARKGVFITTSTFTAEAREYVKRIEKKIVLIDGTQLAAYMVDFGIGVNPVTSYEIKRVDSDYFTEE
jgi:restriction system protein